MVGFWLFGAKIRVLFNGLRDLENNKYLLFTRLDVSLVAIRLIFIVVVEVITFFLNFIGENHAKFCRF